VNEKEVSELRRRFKPEKNNISKICGCYVNEQKEVIALFDESLTMMDTQESEKFLSLLKKSLTGALGKNLIDITFGTRQVMDSDEHRLLRTLWESGLKDTGALETFYQRVIESCDLPGQYLILMGADIYDVPYRSGFGEAVADASDQTFRYFVCSICPVKEQPPALCYQPSKNEFHAGELMHTVAAPELGFLFPAFDDRATNIYNALYYCKDTATCHDSFVDRVFHTPLPMPAAVQNQSFHAMLGETLAEECSLEVMQTVHDRIAENIALHKAEKNPETLTVSRGEVSRMLDDCGVSQTKRAAFEEEYEKQFGAATDIPAKNLVDTARFELRTPDVVIQVNSQRPDLVETRVLDGTRYILIRAEEGVEVNGVNVVISKEE